MIVETNEQGEDEAWIVHPAPGYVVKFKEVVLGSDLFPDEQKYKLFLNICHCTELPPPVDDLDEDSVASILDSDTPDNYRIPLSVGELECIKDHKGENSAKIDVIVNSVFFVKRLEKSEFFRQLFLLVTCEAVQNKHKISLVPKNSVTLKNRKVIGELASQRIRKKPKSAEIEEIDTASAEVDELPDIFSCTPKNCLLTIHNGTFLEIKVKFPSLDSPIENCERISVKMDDSHIIVILDRLRKIADFFIPVVVDSKNSDASFLVSDNVLRITARIIWPLIS